MPDAAPNGKSRYLLGVLITILLALTGGILREVIDHGKQLAKLSERIEALAGTVEELKPK